MFFKNILFCVCLLPLITSQEYYDYASDCPEEDGFFSDFLQCDKYYECKEGEVIEHVCADGLVFDERSKEFPICSFPFSINCTGRPELQPPQPSVPECPRLNGYFADPDPEICDVFYFCVEGKSNRVQCPSGLVFNPSLGQCGFKAQSSRTGCKSRSSFQCPEKLNRVDQSRHEDPNSCTEFFLCISGEARKSGCSPGLVYQQASTSCQRQDVLEDNHRCRNHFNQTYLDSVLPKRKPKPRPSTIKGFGQRRRVPGNTSQRRRPVSQTSFSNFEEPVQQTQPEPVNREPEFSNLPPQLQELAQNSDLGVADQDQERKTLSNRRRISARPTTSAR
jgi:hypothetical protein